MIELLPSSAAGPRPSAALPHVLLVIDQFPRTLGGGERIALRLAALLPRYGFRASVLTFAVHPESPVLRTAYPFPIHLLPITRTWDLTALRAALALGSFLRAHQVRIVQTFFESSDLWAGLVTKSLSSAALVWSRRDMGILRSGKHHHAYRLLSRLPDQLFAVSEQVRMVCIETDRVESTRIQTIYNGLDLATWPRLPRPEKSSGWHVSTVGNLRRVKGHDVFLRAASLVLDRFPDTTFSIAGEVLEPAYFAELERLHQELGLSDRLRFLGGLADPRPHLAATDLFVLPSRSEGFSNAILEAMAAGLPVVATDVGGNAEAVQNQSTGLIVPTEDHAALAHAILRLLADPECARAMGSAGRERLEHKFSSAAMMRQLTTAYSRLLRR